MITLPFVFEFSNNYHDETDNNLYKYQFDVTFPTKEQLISYQNDDDDQVLDFSSELESNDVGVHNWGFDPDTECNGFHSYEVKKENYQGLMEQWKEFHESLGYVCGPITYTITTE